jgi:hypothetical protein
VILGRWRTFANDEKTELVEGHEIGGRNWRRSSLNVVVVRNIVLCRGAIRATVGIVGVLVDAAVMGPRVPMSVM